MSIGRLDRLSQYVGLKYGLLSNAATKKVDLAWIKKDLTDMVRTYIADPPVAYNIVPLLAQHFRDPFCQSLIENMIDLVTNIKSSSPELLFEQLSIISDMIKDEMLYKSEIRSTIHGYYKRDKDREMAKNKFEAVVFEILPNLIKKSGEELAEMYGFDASEFVKSKERQPKELSKEEMWAWIHGHPAAGKYGLDDEDVFAKVYEDLELRHELTRIIYATKRARSPRQTAEVQKAVLEFMELAKQRLTNENYFEAGEDAAKEFARPKFVMPSDKAPNEKDFEGPDPGYDPEFVAQRDKQESERLRLQERNRLEEEDRKNKEEEAARHIRSEGSNLLKALIKKRYL